MTTTYLGAQTIGGSMPAIVDGLAAALQLANPPPYPPRLSDAMVGLIVQVCQQGRLEFLPYLTRLTVQRDLVTGLQAKLPIAGLHGYSYAGPVNALGGELTTALASGLPGGAPGDSANALVLVTTTPATWAALGQLLKVTP